HDRGVEAPSSRPHDGTPRLARPFARGDVARNRFRHAAALRHRHHRRPRLVDAPHAPHLADALRARRPLVRLRPTRAKGGSMNAPRWTVGLVAVLALAFAKDARADAPLTMEQAVAIALERNRDVIAARLDIRAAELDQVAAGLYPNPIVAYTIANLPIGA